MDSIRQEIIRVRSKLLDLGNDNVLLNYRRKDDRSLTLSDRDPGLLFDQLVVNEKGLTVVTSKEGRSAEIEDILKAPYSSIDIENRIQKLAHASQDAMDEQGYPNLFLVMGLLAWVNRDGQKFRSPLILLPCVLRPDTGGNLQLHWSGHDVLVSPTLVERMKELGIKIPELADPQDGAAIRRHQAELREILRPREGFELVNSQILDCFSFTNSVLYQDLDPANWSTEHVSSHPLLNAVFHPGSLPEKKNDLSYLQAGDFCILDADASQMDVLDDVVRGNSVVVEGPPGTGKSQTIANIICESLGRGKKVLFVSEKMAALEVVKARLDRAGMSPYILELHSEKSNRKALIRELDRSLTYHPESIEPELPDPRLAKLAEELDSYARAISEPTGKRGLSTYDMIGQRETILASYALKGREPQAIEVKEPDFIDKERWSETMNALQVLQELLPPLAPLRDNPWLGCELSDLPLDGEKTVTGAIRKTLRYLEDTQDVSRMLAKSMGMEPPLSIGDNYTFSTECHELLESATVSMVNLLDDGILDYETEISDTLELLRFMQETKAILLGNYESTLFDLDHQPLLDTFEKHVNSPLRFLYGRFRKAKKTLKIHSKDSKLEDDEALLEHLRMLAEYQAADSRLIAKGPEARRFFGSSWVASESNIQSLEKSFQWASKLKKNLKTGRYSDTTLIAISRSNENPLLRHKLQDLDNKLGKLMQSLDSLTAVLGTDMTTLFRPGKDGLRPHQIRNRLRLMESGTALLNRWSQYRRTLKQLSNGPAEHLVSMIEGERIAPADLRNSFELGYLEGMLRIVGDVRPALRGFSAEEYEVSRREFSNLDRESLLKNRNRLLHVLKTRASSAGDYPIAMRVLKGEINRSRGNLPVRRLMSESSEVIQSLKPCFMMSPLSVAQFLDNRSVRFDLVIFDEASQLLPEESMGALLRSKQAVVMGDSYQLPPSQFFEIQGQVQNSVATLADMESLLGICRTAFPVLSLQWHYRSRHQSLMEVPNMLFYDHRLLIPPSPHFSRDGIGLQLTHLRSTVYERGVSGTNPKEAQRISRAVREHYQQRPELSLAVATFSLRQKEAIEGQVARMKKRYPEIARLMQNAHEPFMVRNLENLQGDERDVIMVSIGYGFDVEGRLSLSFGPLNRDGGERRLNVLMTRARYSCIIFSNFRATDMKIKPDTPAGVRHLQTFLQYAESKRMFLEDFEPSTDPLVNSVADYLRSKGVEVDVNMGNPGFRIDIAVRSRDASRHILAVILDGPRYQTLKRVRDRDRLWEGLLQNLGWDTYRVWSQDWYGDPEGARARLWNRTQSVMQSHVSVVQDSPVSAQDVLKEEEAIDLITNQVAVLEIILQQSPMHREAVAQEFKVRRGRTRMSATLRKEVDDLIALLVKDGKVQEQNDMLSSPGPCSLDSLPDVDRRDWLPEWLPECIYVQILKSYDVDARSDSEEMLKIVSDRLRLRKGKLLRDYLQSIPLD